MTTFRKKLVLIDGSSYLFRAFHGMPPLSNKDGEPTGALFGVVNMLRQTLKSKPDYLAFVLDPGGKNFRHEMYPEYKANRPPMPDELRAQVQPMIEIVEALGIPLLRLAGFEADDVIGTLANHGERHQLDVTISTSDKDLAQLVDPFVSLLNTMSNTTMNEAGVMEKFGVRPDQIADYLALMGDTVDNIPGVDKCGPKTAAKWLAEFGTMEAVMANADKISGKVGENLRDALPRLPLSKQLTLVKRDMELGVEPENLVMRERDTEKLRTLFTRYGFNQALKELDGGAAIDISNLSERGTKPFARGSSAAKNEANLEVLADGKAAPNQTYIDSGAKYSLITTQAEFEIWLARLRECRLFAFDTETTSINPLQAEIVGVSIAIDSLEAAYVPLAHNYPGAPTQLDREHVLASLKPILENESIKKIGQHGKYDMHVLGRYGIALNGYEFDTMLESYVWNSTATQHNMDAMAKKYLNYDTIKFEAVAGKGAKQITFDQVDLDTATTYAAEDADITLRLHKFLYPKLNAFAKLKKVFNEIEMPLVKVLQRIEARGIHIDANVLAEQTRSHHKRMNELTLRAHALGGQPFSLDSPKQLQAILFDKLGLPITQKTPTGQASTNEEALSEIADQHELPQVILDYRTLAKLTSTYTERLPEQINPRTGRVHTSFHQATAATGRLASSDPNLQNIPIRTSEGRAIRKAFITEPGWKIVSADYSQIELRILAHVSDDPGLLNAFHQGIDVHRATAAEVFGVEPKDVNSDQRRAAKAINFGLMYGMSAFGLARQIGVTRGEASDYMNRYFTQYPNVHHFMEKVRKQARELGYVETVFGRRLYLNEINSRVQGLRQGAERAAINAPMQGTAADIIKRAMITIDAWLQPMQDRAAMLLQVHDELVLEVREDCVDDIVIGLKQRMSAAAELKVPLDVEVGVGPNWDEAH